MLILFIGPPGSGKGTQSARLLQLLKLPHLSTGDMLREANAAGTELGKLAASYMDAGQLVPDEIVVDVVGSRLAQPDCAGGALLDGFPRTMPQAEALDNYLQTRNGQVNLVIELHCDDEELIRRLLQRAKIEGRADDSPEMVAKRQAIYREQTAPLLEYYRDRGVLISIDGMQTPDEVFAEIEAAVKQTTATSE